MDLRPLSRGGVVMGAVIDLELGWSEVMREIAHLEAIVDDLRHGRALRGRIDNQLYMTIFTLIYNMTQQERGRNCEQIYHRLGRYVKSYVARAVEPSLRQAVENGDYIAALHANWKVYRVFAKWVRSFFCCLDRYHTTRQGLPSVREVIVRPFRAAAISAVLSQVSHENLALSRCLVHATEFYMRSQYPSVKIDPALDITSTVCEFSTLPLNTPADMDLGWVLHDSNIDAITNFAASSKLIVATLPSSQPITKALHLSISSRMILNGLVMNDLVPLPYTSPDGVVLPAIKTARKDFYDMRSVGTKHRAYQLLLLSTIMSRGADSEEPLVTVDLSICEDLCDMVRDHLDAMPAFCIVDETFAWRRSDTSVKRPRLS